MLNKKKKRGEIIQGWLVKSSHDENEQFPTYFPFSLVGFLYLKTNNADVRVREPRNSSEEGMVHEEVEFMYNLLFLVSI